ncbi:MAG: AbrB/MazE/SpoVT family DNA-binding domain-containing protein [Cyclobacteriaceae bacterium]
MELPIIPIGNSKGIRLPKTVLEKYNIKDSVEMVMEKSCIILKPKTNVRAGWDKAFKEMKSMGDEQQLLPDVFEEEDFEEWS